MSDQLLGALKICLLILLYLFFARVLWAVWSEVRFSKAQATDSRSPLAAPSPIPASTPRSKAGRRRRGESTVRAADAAMFEPGVTGAIEDGGDRLGDGTTRTSRPLVDAGSRERRAVKPRRGVVTRLVVLEPRAMKGVAYPLGGDEITVGRGGGCTVTFENDTFLSTLHARVYRTGEQATVEDLGSTNGSFLNGNRLNAPAVLHKGDRLQVGQTVLEVE